MEGFLVAAGVRHTSGGQLAVRAFGGDFVDFVLFVFD